MMNHKLDVEEHLILESYENDEWKSIPNLKDEIDMYQELASEQIISFSLPRNTFEKLRRKADADGISYQNLVLKLVMEHIN
jgi:predicted DNA binding CopG/RHH family protein